MGVGVGDWGIGEETLAGISGWHCAATSRRMKTARINFSICEKWEDTSLARYDNGFGDLSEKACFIPRSVVIGNPNFVRPQAEI